MEQPGSGTYHHYQVERLSEGVFAAIATWEGAAGSNAGIVDLGGRTLVLDTSATVVAARELRRICEDLTGRPPAYVVNSHIHPDHVNGNVVFDADAVLISSTATREALVADGLAGMARMREQMADQAEGFRRQLADAKDDTARTNLEVTVRAFDEFLAGYPTPADLRLPALTCERSLTLHGDRRIAKLIVCGRAHSPSDSVLWLPAEQVLFTADLVVVPGNNLAITNGGAPDMWQALLGQLEVLGARTLVPGHGNVTTAEAGFPPVWAYLSHLLAVAATAPAGEDPVTFAAQAAVPDGWAPGRFRQNLTRLLQRPAVTCQAPEVT